MTKFSRRAMLLGLAGMSIGCGGFNPFLLPYVGGDTKTPAEFPLKPVNKKKEPSVVVLVSGKTGLPTDLTGIDRMLNAELIQILDARLKENEEKVQLFQMPAIDRFRNDNANWRALKPYDIGKEFNADYMIDVEIQDIDLFKPGSRGQFLQGRAAISVNVYDMSKPLREAAKKWDMEFEYPRSGEVPVESRSQVSAFRTQLVQRIASDVSVKFTATPTTARRVD